MCVYLAQVLYLQWRGSYLLQAPHLQRTGGRVPGPGASPAVDGGACILPQLLDSSRRHSVLSVSWAGVRLRREDPLRPRGEASEPGSG